MKVTLRDIAKKANVSLSTVSRALSGTGYIKEETLMLVINACKELGYVASDFGKSKKNEKIIAVITADLRNEFNLVLIESFCKSAETYGYEIVIYDQQEDSKRSIRALESISRLPVSGIILTPVMDVSELGYSYLGALEKLKIPIVLVDRDIKYSHFDGVFLDNITGSYNAVMALVNEGHKRIATITGTQSSLTGRERLAGYKKALLINNIQIVEHYIQSGDFTVAGGKSAALRLFDLTEPPEAVFIANSVMMNGFVSAIKERKMKIPKDISTISFDDLVTNNSFENLSVVAQPMKIMGEKAMEILLDRMSEPLHYKKETIRIVLNPSILLRGSECNEKTQ